MIMPDDLSALNLDFAILYGLSNKTEVDSSFLFSLLNNSLSFSGLQEKKRFDIIML